MSPKHTLAIAHWRYINNNNQHTKFNTAQKINLSLMENIG
jgi:hypothetical protein